MKKILMILMICFGVSIIANAQKRSCPVYGSDYTAEIEHGYTLVQAGDWGNATVCVNVSGPVATGSIGDKVIVYVNLLDRSTNCVVATEKCSVFVEKDHSKGSGSAHFSGLTKGEFYLASIDSASCKQE